MSTWKLDPLLDPSTIALVGASERSDSPGQRLARNLRNAGYPGRRYFVNPRYRRVCDEPCYRTLAELPHKPDLVLFIGPERIIRRTLVQCARIGVGIVILMSSIKDLKRLRQLARRLEIRLLGPRCAGLIRPSRGLNASLSSNHIVPGKLAILTQSSSLGAAIIDWAESTGVGFSALVSTGDEIDVRLADLMDLLTEDDATRAIIVYLDRIDGARGFLSAISAAARNKPVVLMKSVGNTAPFTDALLRTGHQYSSDAALEAALGRAGVVRIHSFGNLFAAANILARGTRVAGPRLAIIANGKAPAMLACARLETGDYPLRAFQRGLRQRLSQRVGAHASGTNPLVLRHVHELADAYRASIDEIRNSGEADAVLVMYTPDSRHDPLTIAEAVIACLPSALPILTCWMGEASVGPSRDRFAAANLPSFRTPDAAVDGFDVLYRFYVNQQQLLQLPGPPATELKVDRHSAIDLLSTALAEGRRILDDTNSRRLLRCFAVETAKHRHRTDTAGRDQQTAVPDLRLLAVVLYRDATFGPVIALGAGGALAALLPQRVLQLPPLNHFLIDQMLNAPALSALLGSFDQHPPINRAVLAEVLLKVSAMATELPDLHALYIEGLDISDAGAAVGNVTATVEVSRGAHRHAHLAIPPYPADWSSTSRLPDGRRVRLRPIRPEDGAAVQALVRGLSPQSRYFRFMHSINELSPRMIAAFTKLDYDRQMAFVALDPDDHIVGVSRYAMYGDGRGAEFAVTVTDAWAGGGLGRQLIDRLVHYARAAGLEWLEGTVHQDNEPMHAFMHALGADVVGADATEPVIRYRLPLRRGQPRAPGSAADTGGAMNVPSAE